VICDDDPAVCSTVLAADRLQLGERLERGLPESFVARDVMRRSRRLPVGVDIRRVDGKHLALESAFRPRVLRALLRMQTELVAVGAR